MNDPQQRPMQPTTSLLVAPRFFAAPKMDERLQDIFTQYSKVQQKRLKKDTKMVRYAGYVRISSEEQVGNYSVEAQKRAIQTWVQAQQGQIVQMYVDEAHSGRTSERPEFQKMRQDARKGKFEALVVHKFDRFSRNRTDALAIKSLLRYDYNVKVYSVTEPSEDSDGAIGALIEGIMESVAEWYSRNLAAEVAKGRREKGTQGYHNNQAPFGYLRDGKRLVPAVDELPGLQMAFQAYANGEYGYADIARLLTQNGYRSKSGRPFSKDTIRDILKNRIYLGEVRYQETRRNSDGKRNFSAPTQWFKGQHEAIIAQELFDRCQQVRENRNYHHQSPSRYNPYLLRGIVYCHRCCSNPVVNADFPSWGKMICQTQQGTDNSYYRCNSKWAGVITCQQGGVRTQVIDEQVLSVLTSLRPPDNWRNRIISTVSEILGEKNLEERLNEIRRTIERMDFRWDNGFITDKADYLEKRLKLQQELEKLTPVQDELDQAADLLENFRTHWDDCKEDIEKQHQLVKLIVERVYVEDDVVVAMTLKSDYHIVLGHKGNEPTSISMEVDPHIHEWAQRDSNP
ncbi:MAG: recombinase family protein [Chloroflexota bacterium]